MKAARHIGTGPVFAVIPLIGSVPVTEGTPAQTYVPANNKVPGELIIDTVFQGEGKHAHGVFFRIGAASGIIISPVGSEIKGRSDIKPKAALTEWVDVYFQAAEIAGVCAVIGRIISCIPGRR